MKSYNFMNYQTVRPIQRAKVDDFINKHKDNDNVIRIIVFGSSITNKCHIDSDIDVYLELKENKPIQRFAYNYLVDIWNNYTVDKNMLNEIYKKGVIVYER